MNETEKRDRRDEKEEIRYHVIFYGQVQGDEETIMEMIKRIRTSSYIEITDAKWTKIPLESEFGFHIR